MTHVLARTRRAHAAAPAWLTIWALLPLLLIALPLCYVAIRASQAGLAGVAQELLRERTLMLLLNTVALAVGVTLTASMIGLAVAWCVERSDLPLRRFWRVAAGLPLAVPAFVSSYAWSSIAVGFQSLPGALLVLSLSTYPLVYLPVAAALRSADPAFEDVSRSLGHGPTHTFLHALLPQLIPALGGGSLLVLTHMFSEFGALALLRVQTFTTAIFESYELQFDSATAAVQSIVLMALCIPAAYGEMRVRGHRRIARMGRGAARMVPSVRLGKARLLVLLAFGGLGLLSLGVPLATLGYWLAHGRSLGQGYEEIWPAIRGSIGYATSGAVLASILAMPLVLLSIRYRNRFSSLAERLPYIVHGLPGVVVALALVFLSIRAAPALYQTSIVLLCAYAILFLPLAQSSLRASIELISPQLEQIARSLGRSPFRVFMSVVLPNIAPGIGAALALMMLEIFRELTATLMLAPTGVTTLATQVWSYTFDAEYAAAAPFATLLVLISSVPVWVFTRRMLQYGGQP
ncbi:ABC transporter permease [Allopusillimonas soli]|uniref:ABC transporter permease n=1 Tax=Allopusillimonas soli TaxID=659016 RepID=UPI001ADD34FC|nr:iron ABC transporter permease [Allopusillimonas soli]